MQETKPKAFVAPLPEIPQGLLRKIQLWLRDHGNGEIILNAHDHKLYTYHFPDTGKVADLEDKIDVKSS